MDGRPLTNEEFAHRLRRAISAKGVTLRALGRDLDPSDPDRARRSLQRYLAGDHQPRPRIRASLAAALDVTEAHLSVACAGDSVDEDSSEALMREVRELRRDVKDLKWLLLHGAERTVAA